MPHRSNAKGSGFERKICRLLTEWVDPRRKGGQPEIFWRSATSGAKATQDHKQGRASEMGGDIVAIHETGIPLTSRFSVECKNRKTYGKLESMMDGAGPLLKWWIQCVEDAARWNRIPLLIFQCNSPIYILTEDVFTWSSVSSYRPKLPDAAAIVHSESVAHAVQLSRLDEWLVMNPWLNVLNDLMDPR